MSEIGALVCVVHEMPSSERLAAVRRTLIDESGLEAEDFYGGQPLVVVDVDECLPFDVPAELPVLNVHLHRAYYSTAYTRGDPNTYIRCAEILERELPGVRIYYGAEGGAPGVEFTHELRQKLRSDFDARS